ncbi:matrixin family metalloprotease [Cellulomonas persica]|uniref:matrixin family metalloprotease n=1 Tax=Cellulomonas persica TaxID=76861 RepID=UPI0011BD4609
MSRVIVHRRGPAIGRAPSRCSAPGAKPVSHRVGRGRCLGATTSASGRSSRDDLEGVATHEAGHVFGLNHVDRSSLQVMKPYSGSCESGQRKLGPGDLRGMNALFP